MHAIFAKFGALAIAPSLFFGGWWGHTDHDTNKQPPRTGVEQHAALAITSVNGPSQLAVDEEGTWTVAVKTKDDATLHYSVKWGDEATASTMRAAALVDATSTFTHSYASAGTYKPEFTVTDDNGRSVTKSAKVTVGTTTNDALTLTSVAPASAAAGASVTAYGTGFMDGDTVQVGGMHATDVVVNSDTSITFTVPSLKTGTYNVRVFDENNKHSQNVKFTVTAKTAAISINGVDAPVSLMEGEEGTWTVNVGTSASNLHYAVQWGDEPMTLARLFAANDTVQTSSTFTHTYETAGSYMPKFTVTDDNGHSASVSASVQVKAATTSDDQ